MQRGESTHVAIFLSASSALAKQASMTVDSRGNVTFCSSPPKSGWLTDQKAYGLTKTPLQFDLY